MYLVAAAQRQAAAQAPPQFELEGVEAPVTGDHAELRRAARSHVGVGPEEIRRQAGRGPVGVERGALQAARALPRDRRDSRVVVVERVVPRRTAVVRRGVARRAAVRRRVGGRRAGKERLEDRQRRRARSPGVGEGISVARHDVGAQVRLGLAELVVEAVLARQHAPVGGVVDVPVLRSRRSSCYRRTGPRTPCSCPAHAECRGCTGASMAPAAPGTSPGRFRSWSRRRTGTRAAPGRAGNEPRGLPHEHREAVVAHGGRARGEAAAAGPDPPGVVGVDRP